MEYSSTTTMNINPGFGFSFFAFKEKIFKIRMAILSFSYLITSLDLRIPNHISLGKFSDGGGWKSLPFEKPFLKS